MPASSAAGVRVDAALAARLHARANASRWQVPVDAFASALEASARHAFADQSPSASDIARYLDSLRLDDLALACACAAGHEEAWDHFVFEHRPALYRAAEAIDRSGGARELADSLYADLFGLREHDGERRSLFRYFHGRSSLGSWVRAVLSQRFIDRVRAARRLDPLPDEESAAAIPSERAEEPAQAQTFRTAMQAALAAAVATLAPRDRLRLGWYYGQNLKLAAIGRLLKEHEATVSRHLARTRREVRDAVERYLRDTCGYDDRAIAECYATVSDDSGSIDLTAIMDASETGKKSVPDRS